MFKAQATVETEKAARYLKALCNHFDRKVKAEYNDTQGTIACGFADCQMEAIDSKLQISIQAETDENFGRVKYVVSDHLIRFAPNEDLSVDWVEEA
jgi:hypothetical protein